MDRRTFLAGSLSAGAVASLGITAAAQSAGAASPGRRHFKLRYAPHFGMFEAIAGKDMIDQLKFMADQGFTALEDNGMAGRPVDEQEKLAAAMSRLGIAMGVFVVNMGTAWGPTLATGKKEERDKFLDECRKAVDVAKRVNAKWMTVVPGTLDGRLEPDYQNANVIDALRRGAEIFEPHGLVMVLEPLNHRRDHPGLFLTKIAQAYLICKAVNSSACKILFDLYHQQITEGNLIPNIDLAWDEIGYFQVGDNPGRNEPTTGEVNYRNVFRHIHKKGFGGIVGMEHGNSRPGKEGCQAVIDAYVASDDF
jgi:hydroxypyruvate isomerase